MARSTRAVQETNRAGLAETFSAADNANGESIPNDGRTILHVKNTGGGACTVSVAKSGISAIDGDAVAAKTASVPATTGDRLIGPFPIGIYGNPLLVDYSTGTGVTAAAVRVP